MRILIAGCGNIGAVAAEDIARKTNDEVVVADVDKSKAQATAKKIGSNNATSIKLDVTNHVKLIDILKGFNLVMGFLPGKLGHRLAEACIEAQKDLVDVSYMGENPLDLNERATEAGVTIVPDCGLAPGISNVMVGHASGMLDRIDSIHIMVGGLPETPIPPLGYVVTWSPESLIDEYTRRVGIIKAGQKIEVEALSGLEEINFPKIGKLEAFYTDGLRTLLWTMSNVNEAWEKTLRYVGHVERIRLLRSLGFFDEEPVDTGEGVVSPRKLTTRLFKQKLQRSDVRDVVALRVDVSGFRNRTKTCFRYQLLDFYDEKDRVTAMARTTAYPASIIGQMILRKIIKEKGVVPPEKIGMDERLFKIIMRELEKHGIEVSEEKTNC